MFPSSARITGCGRAALPRCRAALTLFGGAAREEAGASRRSSVSVGNVTDARNASLPKREGTAPQRGSSFSRMLRKDTVPWSPCRKIGPGSVTFLSISLPVALLHSTLS